MWRCPHCGTPQAETARCWVCRRSSTACGSCRHFRRAVAGGLGYCGLDRRRSPLVGDEIRACWEAAATSTEPPAGPPPAAATVLAPLATAPAMRGFVDIDTAQAEVTASTEMPAGDAADAVLPPRPPSPEPGWSLWAELEG
jgi:hypothetical protein